MASPDLRSATAKWDWARIHAETLKKDVVLWADGEPEPAVAFRREFHAEDGYVSFWIDSVKPIRPRWGLMFGDSLNNYRSALDHLAWELVRTGRTPNPKDPTRIQFPICYTNRTKFLNEVCPDRLPGVSKQRCAMLSPFQPYRRRAWRQRDDRLRVLFDLTRRDKHQQLLLTVLRPKAYKITFPAGVRPRSRAFGQPGADLQPNTEAVRVYITPWNEPEPDVNVIFDPAREVSIEPDGIRLLSTLSDMHRLVIEVLGKFL